MVVMLLENLTPLMHEEETGNLWHDFLSVALDPAHILSELAFTIVFDGIVIAVLWGLVFKGLILPRLRRQIHSDIDQEHGIQHDGAGFDHAHDEHHHD